MSLVQITEPLTLTFPLDFDSILSINASGQEMQTLVSFQGAPASGCRRSGLHTAETTTHELGFEEQKLTGEKLISSQVLLSFSDYFCGFNTSSPPADRPLLVAEMRPQEPALRRHSTEIKDVTVFYVFFY